VHFCGFLSQPDLRELYARSHFSFIRAKLSQIRIRKACRTSVLEADGNGLAGDRDAPGGIPEAVDGKLQRFSSATSAITESLGRSMVALANSPEIYARF
jgi:hypothetical protein